MSGAFDEAFQALRAIMLQGSSGLTITTDAPGELVVRTPPPPGERGEPGWFGTVTVKKAYVAFHLMPLYTRPDLAADLSPELSRRRQGKTCFNFKRPDAILFDELAVLTRRAREVV